MKPPALKLPGCKAAAPRVEPNRRIEHQARRRSIAAWPAFEREPFLRDEHRANQRRAVLAKVLPASWLRKNFRPAFPAGPRGNSPEVHPQPAMSECDPAVQGLQTASPLHSPICFVECAAYR